MWNAEYCTLEEVWDSVCKFWSHTSLFGSGGNMWPRLGLPFKGRGRCRHTPSTAVKYLTETAKNAAGTQAFFFFFFWKVKHGDGAVDTLKEKKTENCCWEWRLNIWRWLTKRESSARFLIVFLVPFKWSARRTWTARQWPSMWTRSTASRATARNMGPKATASGAVRALWAWTPEKDLESSLYREGSSTSSSFSRSRDQTHRKPSQVSPNFPQGFLSFSPNRQAPHRPTNNPNASKFAQRTEGSDVCPRCQKTVYAAEKCLGAGKVGTVPCIALLV